MAHGQYNIVVINPDQMRADYMTSNGHPFINTARLSRLAQKGANLRAPHGPSHFGPGAMLRTVRWKLCSHSFDGWELFDLENDPAECRNLYEDPEHAAIARALTHRLMARMLCGGQAPEHLPHPKVLGVDAAGMPIWNMNYDHIELCDGYRP